MVPSQNVRKYPELKMGLEEDINWAFSCYINFWVFVPFCLKKKSCFPFTLHLFHKEIAVLHRWRPFTFLPNLFEQICFLPPKCHLTPSTSRSTSQPTCKAETVSPMHWESWWALPSGRLCCEVRGVPISPQRCQHESLTRRRFCQNNGVFLG